MLALHHEKIEAWILAQAGIKFDAKAAPGTLREVATEPSHWITMTSMLTVAELPEFIRVADKLLTEPERMDIIRYLAERPKAGDLMESTGGVRKLRWGRGGQGKSGGVRVIYYFHDEAMLLYLLTLFAKGDQANLSKAERSELAGLVKILVQIWKRKSK